MKSKSHFLTGKKNIFSTGLVALISSLFLFAKPPDVEAQTNKPTLLTAAPQAISSSGGTQKPEKIEDTRSLTPEETIKKTYGPLKPLRVPDELKPFLPRKPPEPFSDEDMCSINCNKKEGAAMMKCLGLTNPCLQKSKALNSDFCSAPIKACVEPPREKIKVCIDRCTFEIKQKEARAKAEKQEKTEEESLKKDPKK